MECSKCNTEMIKGVAGKEAPFNLRFVPENHKLIVKDFPMLNVYACPECGYVEFSVNTESLLKTIKERV